MRRFISIAFICICHFAAAQNYDVVNEVRSDFRKIGGMEGPHRFDAPAPTPASKGYKPFYISHSHTIVTLRRDMATFLCLKTLSARLKQHSTTLPKLRT